MTRVEADTARNQRIPNSVTISYTVNPGGAWIGRSFRIPFPTATGDFDARVQKLVDGARKIITERGHGSFIRLGFSATDFVPRPKVGIGSFFSKRKNPSTPTEHLVSGKNARASKAAGIDSFCSSKTSKPVTKMSEDNARAKPVCIDSFYSTKKSKPTTKISEAKLFPNRVALHEADKPADDVAPELMAPFTNTSGPAAMTDEEMAKQLQESYNAEATERGRQHATDRDKALACQLQSSFDREHSVLSHVERFSAKGKGNAKSRAKANSSKKSKIDYFLQK